MVSIQKNTKQHYKSELIPQKTASIVPFKGSRIVCTNKNCTRINVCVQEAIEETVGHCVGIFRCTYIDYDISIISHRIYSWFFSFTVIYVGDYSLSYIYIYIHVSISMFVVLFFIYTIKNSHTTNLQRSSFNSSKLIILTKICLRRISKTVNFPEKLGSILITE